MKYKYIPDSYNNSIIKERFMEDEFIELQVKYRKYLESILSKFIDFKKIDEKIKEVINIPKIEDKDYNFYHKFSSLNSDYVYLRNNYHIENLSDEEINKIRQDKMDFEFINKTIPKVVFETGDKSFYGTPIEKYLADSKGLVFEFSYDQIQLIDIKEYKTIKQIEKELSNVITKTLNERLKIPVTLIEYNGLNDLYKIDNMEEKQIKHN